MKCNWKDLMIRFDLIGWEHKNSTQAKRTPEKPKVEFWTKNLSLVNLKTKCCRVGISLEIFHHKLSIDTLLKSNGGRKC